MLQASISMDSLPASTAGNGAAPAGDASVPSPPTSQPPSQSVGKTFATMDAPYLRYLEAISHGARHGRFSDDEPMRMAGYMRELIQGLDGIGPVTDDYNLNGLWNVAHQPVAQIIDIGLDCSIREGATLGLNVRRRLSPAEIDLFTEGLHICVPDVHTRILAVCLPSVGKLNPVAGSSMVWKLLFTRFMGVEVGLRPSDMGLLLGRLTAAADSSGWPSSVHTDLARQPLLRSWQHLRPNIFVFGRGEGGSLVSAGCYRGRRPLSSAAPYMGEHRELSNICLALLKGFHAPSRSAPAG